MTPRTTPQRWLPLAASHIGSVHVRDGTPSQDAHHVWSDSSCAVIAVADGHGHPAHFRSAVGSQIATYVATYVLRSAVGSFVDPGLVERQVATTIGPKLVDGWTAAVLDHVARHPYIPREAEIVGGTTDRDLIQPYGTTIIAMAASHNVLAVLQLGDGNAVVVSRSGEVFEPLPPDPELDGRRTTSLCQADPLRSLRGVGLDASSGIALGFICTDGFGSPQLDTEGWWRQVGAELFQHLRDSGADWVAAKLPGWLEEPAQMGGDDTTLAVLACTTKRVTVPGSSSRL